MTTAEQNYLLLQEIEANRRFLLMAYQQNPKLLERADARIKQLFELTAPRESGEVNAAGMTKQRGISLIELIMFIVIVSVALAGILLVLNVTTKSSADPLIHKQALAVAESLLEEIELMPFTYCDPTDPLAGSATSTGMCSAGLSQDVITGPVPAGATRYPAGTPYNNVADYSTFSMNPILDIMGGGTGLGNYSAVVTMARTGTAFVGAADNGSALLITVTVTGPDGVPVALDGIRTRYSPNP